jgi:hypothetical protein
VKPEEDRGEPRAENVASQLQPKTCKDKLFLFFWVGGFLGGLWMSLQSVGHLLQFNINNLMITSIVFMLMSLNFVAKAPTIDRQIAYASLGGHTDSHKVGFKPALCRRCGKREPIRLLNAPADTLHAPSSLTVDARSRERGVLQSRYDERVRRIRLKQDIQPPDAGHG